MTNENINGGPRPKSDEPEPRWTLPKRRDPKPPRGTLPKPSEKTY